MCAFEDLVRQMIEEAIRARDEAPPRAGDAMSGAKLIDEKTRAEINEYTRISHKPYLTRKEAALYLGVSPRSITEWAARPVDQNPFPESNAGGEPRARREAIDSWAEKEHQRQRLRIAR